MALTSSYFFSGSSGMRMSIWMSSTNFQSVVTLSLNGTVLSTGTDNAWEHDNTYPGAVIAYQLPSDDIYEVIGTSIDGLGTGQYEIYISQGPTQSFLSGLNPPYNYGPNEFIYSKSTNKVFAPVYEQSISGYPVYSYISKLDIIDATTYNIDSSPDIYNSYTNPTASMVVTAVYNTIDENVYVWSVSSSVSISQSLSGNVVGVTSIDVWSGSFLSASYPVSVSWGGFGLQNGNMVFNADKNQILITPKNPYNSVPMFYYIYDCSTNSIVYSGSLLVYGNVYFYPTYVSSTQQYYIPSSNFVAPAQKIDANTYGISFSTMTSSATVLTYIPDIDVIVGSGNNWAGTMTGPIYIHDPHTENIIAEVVNVDNMETPCAYDPCRKCIVIADDTSGGSYTLGGGLVVIYSGSWDAANFYRENGAWWVTYVNSSSTIWTSNYNDNNCLVITLSTPEGNLP